MLLSLMCPHTIVTTASVTIPVATTSTLIVAIAIATAAATDTATANSAKLCRVPFQRLKPCVKRSVTCKIVSNALPGILEHGRLGFFELKHEVSCERTVCVRVVTSPSRDQLRTNQQLGHETQRVAA